MPQYHANRELPFSASHLFDVVADVEKYPEFVPGCSGCRIIRWDSETQFVAEVTYGISALSLGYVCEIILERPREIHVRATEGAFRHLTNHWRFDPTETGCRVEYKLDFDFRSRLMSKIGEKIMHQAALRMIDAFHKRARMLEKRNQAQGRSSGDGKPGEDETEVAGSSGPVR
ncbi:type II toxin-antitoxin system RatA family toxin [Fodinicurvata sp. EGI_FJ10296]|uniref:type II toxin-antitoxin system RatA family toxin n=1 Tax=Fodinicurvata sp. EGI_FJ10296 TaxID=3231908 RepID=UPI0034528289